MERRVRQEVTLSREQNCWQTRAWLNFVLVIVDHCSFSSTYWS